MVSHDIESTAQPHFSRPHLLANSVIREQSPMSHQCGLPLHAGIRLECYFIFWQYIHRTNSCMDDKSKTWLIHPSDSYGWVTSQTISDYCVTYFSQTSNTGHQDDVTIA